MYLGGVQQLRLSPINLCILLASQLHRQCCTEITATTTWLFCVHAPDVMVVWVDY